VTLQQLEGLGFHVGEEFPNQETLDSFLEGVFNLADAPAGKNVFEVKKKIADPSIFSIRSSRMYFVGFWAMCSRLPGLSPT
jgi:hypothetical protein